MKNVGFFGLIALISLVAAGCGDGAPSPSSSFAGTYQVVSHTRNLQGCTAEGDAFEGDKFFKLSETGGGLAYHPCVAADDCAGSNGSKGFDSLDGDQWIGTITAGTKQRGYCEAQLTERTARLVNGDDIHIETRTYAGEFDREDGQECDEALVLAHRSALICGQRDIVVAVPVNN